MIKIIDKNRCCGCGACVAVCPVDAILMVPDGEGFAYPQVNEEKCIKCGKCDKVCSFKDRNKPISRGIRLFAARAKNDDVVKNSSSGGVFSVLAEAILQKGGVVFGAAWIAERQRVEHIGVANAEGLARLRGSKYVQSVIGDAYREAKRLLNAERTVLFSGTPCQLTGLRAYLGKDYDNLVCVDVVCHGVPSPKVLTGYLAATIGKDVSEVRFRDKSKGWRNFTLSVISDGVYKALGVLRDDAYLRGFVSNLFLRPSCCKCKAEKLVSDITLADYWNVNQVVSEFDDDKGTSAVLVCSKKGRQLLEEVSRYMTVKETPLGKFLAANPNTILSSIPHPRRAGFMRKLEGGEAVDSLIKANLKRPWVYDLFRKIKRHHNKSVLRKLAKEIQGVD